MPKQQEQFNSFKLVFTCLFIGSGNEKPLQVLVTISFMFNGVQYNDFCKTALTVVLSNWTAFPSVQSPFYFTLLLYFM